jgi:hypothetical protein
MITSSENLKLSPSSVRYSQDINYKNKTALKTRGMTERPTGIIYFLGSSSS